MHPVLCGLTDKVLLGTTGSGITTNGIALGPNQVIELGELDHKGIVIIAEEWLCIEACRKDRLEIPSRLFLQWRALPLLIFYPVKKEGGYDIHHAS